MRHNISIFDTAPVNSYTHRNEGFLFISGVVGFTAGLTGVIMALIGFLDPMEGISVGVAGVILLLLPLFLALLYVTHRNFGLDRQAALAQDAIYSLPKSERKRYKISHAELKSAPAFQTNELCEAIATYRRTNKGVSGIETMLADINEYNRMVKEIESVS